jgi:hypothetical protein
MRISINDDPHPLIQERGPNDRRSVGTDNAVILKRALAKNLIFIGLTRH